MIAVLPLILLFFAQCPAMLDDSDFSTTVLDEHPDIVRGDGEVRPILEGVCFRFVEAYSAKDAIEQPTLTLRIATIESYGCNEHQLMARAYTGTDTVVVWLLGVFHPHPCLFWNKHASTHLPMELETGSAVLRLISDGRFDEYHLTVTDSSIAVEPARGIFSAPHSRLFWRAPPRSCALLCTGIRIPGDDADACCAELADSLVAAGNLRSFNYPDSGEMYYPSSSLRLIPSVAAHLFTYRGEEDFQRAGELLRRICRGRQRTAERCCNYRLRSWRNEQFP